MTKKAKLSPIEKFLALSDAEKDAAVAKYDKPLPLGPDGLPGKPLTKAQRAMWNKAKKRMGRPIVGQGSKMVPVTIEKGLLKEVDKFTKRHGLKRSQLVAQGLRMVMAATNK